MELRSLILEPFGRNRDGQESIVGAAMIASMEEYKKTKEYTDRIQQVLLGLRAAHSAQEYESMSRANLKELTKAQREIAVFPAVPA